MVSIVKTYGDITIEIGDGWVSVSQRGESNPCVPVWVWLEVAKELEGES